MTIHARRHTAHRQKHATNTRADAEAARPATWKSGTCRPPLRWRTPVIIASRSACWEASEWPANAGSRGETPPGPVQACGGCRSGTPPTRRSVHREYRASGPCSRPASSPGTRTGRVSTEVSPHAGHPGTGRWRTWRALNSTAPKNRTTERLRSDTKTSAKSWAVMRRIAIITTCVKLLPDKGNGTTYRDCDSCLLISRFDCSSP